MTSLKPQGFDRKHCLVDFYKVCSNGALGLKWLLGGWGGVGGLRFENNIYLKLSFTKFVQIVAPKSKMALPHGPGFEPKEYIENIKNLLQNHLAQMPEIWYIALPGGPVPSLFI